MHNAHNPQLLNTAANRIIHVLSFLAGVNSARWGKAPDQIDIEFLRLNHNALVKLLVDKGVITEREYERAVYVSENDVVTGYERQAEATGLALTYGYDVT